MTTSDEILDELIKCKPNEVGPISKRWREQLEVEAELIADGHQMGCLGPPCEC
jgi:hypothetical protein